MSRTRAAASALACWNDAAERLAARFWPGPLTLVLPRAAGSPLSLLVSAGLDTVALRVPAHPLARALLEATGLPVAAPSANPAGEISPTTADHVAKALGDRIDVILDGGPCPIGLESTVVDLTGPAPRLLRPGGLVRGRIEAEIGPLSDGARGCRRGRGGAEPRAAGEPLCPCPPGPPRGAHGRTPTRRCWRSDRGRSPAPRWC